MAILIPIIALTGLGLAFGIGLALAAKKFCITQDPRLERINAKLPGVNCGACGMPGCMGFAEGLIKGSCTVERCAVLKEDARVEIAKILGVEIREKVKTLAVLHCHGGTKRVKERFVYSGLKDCIAANQVMGGPRECVYGCIGFGTCAKVCPFGAIAMNNDGLPVIDEDKCVACGKCVAACPKALLSLTATTKAYAVRCKSHDLGKQVLSVCSVGCIACRKCEKSCPTGAIKVVDNLATIDYHICDNRGACYRACPTKAIAKRELTHWTNER